MSPSAALTKKALYYAVQWCTFQQRKPRECDTERYNTSVCILKALNPIMTINYPNPVWCRWSLALVLKSAGKVLQGGCRSPFYLSWPHSRKSGDCLSFQVLPLLCTQCGNKTHAVRDEDVLQFQDVPVAGTGRSTMSLNMLLCGHSSRTLLCEAQGSTAS